MQAFLQAAPTLSVKATGASISLDNLRPAHEYRCFAPQAAVNAVVEGEKVGPVDAAPQQSDEHVDVASAEGIIASAAAPATAVITEVTVPCTKRIDSDDHVTAVAASTAVAPESSPSISSSTAALPAPTSPSTQPAARESDATAADVFGCELPPALTGGATSQDGIAASRDRSSSPHNKHSSERKHKHKKDKKDKKEKRDKKDKKDKKRSRGRDRSRSRDRSRDRSASRHKHDHKKRHKSDRE